MAMAELGLSDEEERNMPSQGKADPLFAQNWLRGWRGLPKQDGDDKNLAFLTGTRDRLRETLLHNHGVQRGIIR